MSPFMLYYIVSTLFLVTLSYLYLVDMRNEAEKFWRVVIIVCLIVAVISPILLPILLAHYVHDHWESLDTPKKKSNTLFKHDD